MIAANGAVARFLEAHHVSAIRRIVRPERWQRIVELAKEFGVALPAEPDPVAPMTSCSSGARRTPSISPTCRWQW